MSGIIDFVLDAPKNIDWYIYAPGSGGEFFTSLSSIAHKKTRDLLYIKQFLAQKNDEQSENFNQNIIRYNSAKYFIDPELFASIDDIGKTFFHYGEYMDGTERVNYAKMVLFHSLYGYIKYNFYKSSDDLKPSIDNLKPFFKDTNIILCTHWCNKVGAADSHKRNYGLKVFEQQEYWNVINLDPQTPRGQKLVKNFCKKFKLLSNDELKSEKVQKQFDHPAFRNIKLKFPFMDYMVENDLNGVKYYLEDRYGPDLDFDFIDQSLIEYKKNRIDPYL